LQHRVRETEKENGVVQSDSRVLWCADEICEERAADGATVTQRSFARGEQVGGILRFFATDHLGSVTEVSDGSAALLGRYAFDPWGRRTETTGSDVTTVGYIGHRQSADGWAAWFRTFDAETGRWLSEDPGVRFAASYGSVALPDGPNFFAYGRNNPLRFTDPDGLLSGAQAATLVAEACVAVGTATAALLGAAIVVALGQCGDGCNAKGKKGCKPCVPPVGTIAYRADTSPASPPHRGVPPPHWKLYNMSQSPYPVCKCFWDDIPDNRGGFGPGDPPKGTTPIGPAGGGGPK
jgi:RHS repeat-associated protein